MNEAELRQLFMERFDCYADVYDHEEVTPAMTEDRFVYVVGELLKPKLEKGIQS